MNLQNVDFIAMQRYLGLFLRFAKTIQGSIALIIGSFLVVISIATGKVTAQIPSTVRISSQATAHIQALVQEKASRTPAQRKIHSAILYTIKRSQNHALFNSVPSLNTAVKVTTDNKVRVDIKTNSSITTELLQKIKAAGADVVLNVPKYNSIQVLVPVNLVETIAAIPEVKSIKPYVKPVLSRDRIAQVGERGLEPLATISPIAQSLDVAPETAVTNAGKVTSEGDVAHGAAIARATYGVDGSWTKPSLIGGTPQVRRVKVGVLSDSYNNLGGAALDIIYGDLPTDGVTLVGSGDLKSTDPAFPGSDEGRAMLQIIHDLAPGAQLYFATAFKSETDFANNILALRAAGCDIIVDDIGYFDEAVFQDGIVAQAVNSVTKSGALYFSSAGNGGNFSYGTSGVWEGDFVDGGLTSIGRIHSFKSTPITTSNRLTASSGSITLQWSDPYDQPVNDYDLYVINSTGTAVIGASTNFQDGGVGQSPYEIINPQSTGSQVVVVKYSGAARFLHLDTNRGQLAINTLGATYGHSAAVDAYSVAAVSARNRTTLFTTANLTESFSSDGFRRIFYNADDTPTTPNNFLSTGGVLRAKPDIAAADGVLTTLAGLNPFFGTSAAAPHAAAVAALLKSFRPSLTPAQIRTILTQTALDIDVSGFDRDSGYGIVMANRALQVAAQLYPL